MKSEGLTMKKGFLFLFEQRHHVVKNRDDDGLEG